MAPYSLLAALLLSTSALAAPNSAQCNADNCLRAVRATSASPFASSATADCSSFFRKTVTPCPVTNTVTTVATVTGAPVTVTQTAPGSRQSAVGKRGVNAPALPQFPQAQAKFRARDATTVAATCPASSSPTAVPKYASACSGTVRYSSACSCAGITATTTTLTPVTATATSTITTTVTPTATVTVTPPPQCTAYNFVAVGGTYDGQVLNGGTPDPSTISYGFVAFTSDATQASSFVLRDDGKVYGNNVYGWASENINLYYILQFTDTSEQHYSSQVSYLICSLSNGGTSVSGAVGLLSCTIAGNAATLQTCPQTGSNLAQGNSGVAGGCTGLSLAAVPVGTVNC